MNYSAIAEVKIVDKTTDKGYTYQFVRIVLENGKQVDIYCDAKIILSLIYAMNV